MSQVTFVDSNCRSWSIDEWFPDHLAFGVLIFSSGRRLRLSWGSPLNWRDRENLAILFDLSVAAA